jgi:hypothetical protein
MCEQPTVGHASGCHRIRLRGRCHRMLSSARLSRRACLPGEVGAAIILRYASVLKVFGQACTRPPASDCH